MKTQHHLEKGHGAAEHINLLEISVIGCPMQPSPAAGSTVLEGSQTQQTGGHLTVMSVFHLRSLPVLGELQ